jgi:hypothetical protein
MSKVLTTAMTIVTLDIASTGFAHARPINYQRHHFRPNYAGQVYSQAPSVLPLKFVPGRGIVGESCELAQRCRASLL